MKMFTHENIFKPSTQASAQLKLLWFVCQYMYVCICVSASRTLITSGLIQTVCDWLNKFYGFQAVNKMDGCGLNNTARCECLPRRNLYALLHIS